MRLDPTYILTSIKVFNKLEQGVERKLFYFYFYL